MVVACVGGGSNAAGMFYPFLDDASVELVGVEAAGRGEGLGEHAATLEPRQARRAARHVQLCLQDADGQTAAGAFGLGGPGLSRRRAGAQLLEGQRPGALYQRRRRRGLAGVSTCSRLEGILPALETAHAVVEAMRIAAKRQSEDVVVICFSGRGDKDCYEVARLQGEEISTSPNRSEGASLPR